MDTQTVAPQNFAERVIWNSIVWTYAIYLIGGLYILAPVVAWSMLAYLLWRCWLQNDSTPTEQRIHIPLGIWVWVVSMLVMLVSLLVAHLDFNLGAAKTLKSSIGWAKGWALMAIFPLLGCLPIRPVIIYRASTIVCKQTLCILPLLLLGPMLHLPQNLYTSPLQAIGGPGPEFFTVTLYSIDPDGATRWRLFTPWGPALGFIANIYFVFAIQQRGTRWFWYGVLGSIAMCLVSKSRLALVSMGSTVLLTWALSRLTKPAVLYLFALLSSAAGMAAPAIIQWRADAESQFKAARAASSRVRETLGNIAVQRWSSEAPVWGHGIVEKGPHLVEYMPIGSHHSWYGLLFVKGLVGFMALAIPLAWSFIEMLIKAQNSEVARVGLSMVLILFMYTFGENLEILSYLFWPGLLILGIAHREPLPTLTAFDCHGCGIGLTPAIVK